MEVISREKAKKEGLKFYFTGKQCKNGHIEPRYVCNKYCSKCSASSYVENKDEISAKKKAVRKENPEKAKAMDKAAYERNRDKKIAYSKLKWEETKDKTLEERKLRYALNREAEIAQQREWRKNNKDKKTAQRALEKARKLKATPSWFDGVEVGFIYKKCRDLINLGAELYHVDHIVPLQSDFVCGLHWHGNLQILTAYENMSKKNNHWPDMPDTSDPELRSLVKAYKSETNGT